MLACKNLWDIFFLDSISSKLILSKANTSTNLDFTSHLKAISFKVNVNVCSEIPLEIL